MTCDMGNIVFGKTSVESIHIPASLKKLGYRAFYGSSKLKTVTFAQNIQLDRIDEGAFAYTDLTTVEIPDSVKTIDSTAFISSKLENITFGNNSKLEKIDNAAFGHAPLKANRNNNRLKG